MMRNLHNETSIIYEVLTRYQVATFFQVSLRTIDSWGKDGYLKSTKIKRKVFFFKEGVLDSLKRNYK